MITVLYHGIRQARPRHQWDTFARYSPSIDEFRRQIRYLARTYSPIDVETLVRSAKGAEVLPRKALLVTFDDAYAALSKDCLPILMEYRVPAVVFVISAALTRDHLPWFLPFDRLMRRAMRPVFSWQGQQWNVATSDGLSHFSSAFKASLYSHPPKQHCDVVADLGLAIGLTPRELDEIASWQIDDEMNLMDVDDLRAWSAAGLAVGAHSRTHASMVHCRGMELDEEIAGSRRALERLGFSVPTFAYPDGRFDDEAVRAVEGHYEVAFGVDVPSAKRGNLTLPRISLGTETPRDLWVRLANPRGVTAWIERRGVGALGRLGLTIPGWN